MYRKRHIERRETLGYWPARDTKKGDAVGLVTDLSDEGIRIHSAHKFGKGKVLDLRIAVDEALSGTDHISMVVKNVWCHESGVPGFYNAGFKIVNLSDKARKALRRLVDAFSYPAPEQRTGKQAGDEA